MKWMEVNEITPDDFIDNYRFVLVTSDIYGFVYGNAIYFSEEHKPIAGFYNLVDGEWKLDEDVRFWMLIPNPLHVFNFED